MMCEDIIALKANEVCTCVFLCCKNFSVLISNMVNINRYSLYKQNLFGVLSNF